MDTPVILAQEDQGQGRAWTTGDLVSVNIQKNNNKKDLGLTLVK